MVDPCLAVWFAAGLFYWSAQGTERVAQDFWFNGPLRLGEVLLRDLVIEERGEG